jgi:hypothetical protein
LVICLLIFNCLIRLRCTLKEGELMVTAEAAAWFDGLGATAAPQAAPRW